MNDENPENQQENPSGVDDQTPDAGKVQGDSDDAAVSTVDSELDAAPVDAVQGDSDAAEDAAPVESQPGMNVPPSVPGTEERASRLSTGAPDVPESASEDRFRTSSDEPYKDHGEREDSAGPSSKHSDDDSTESKIDDGYEEVAPGVQGRASGQHGAVEAADTGTGSNVQSS